MLSQILAHVSPKPDGRFAPDDGEYFREDCAEDLPDETRDAENEISVPHHGQHLLLRRAS